MSVCNKILSNLEYTLCILYLQIMNFCVLVKLHQIKTWGISYHVDVHTMFVCTKSGSSHNGLLCLRHHLSKKSEK